DMYMTSWSDNYPTTSLLEFAVTPQADVIRGGDAWNIASYNNPDVTELINQAQTIAGCDLEARRALYAEIDNILQEDLPYIWLYSDKSITVLDADVQSVNIQIEDIYYNLADWVVFHAP